MTNYNNNKKNIGCLVAVLLIAVMLVGGLGYLTSGFRNWDASTWFSGNDETEDESNGEQSDILVNNITGNNGISLSSVTLGGTVTITASVKDNSNVAFADLQAVTWEMAWASSNSDAVTNYVTMDSDGMSAMFTLKKAFGTQILVTCASEIKPSVYSTCTIDYMQRASGLTVKVSSIVSTCALSGTTINMTLPDYGNFSSGDDWANDSITPIHNITYGTGSLASSNAGGQWIISPTTEFTNALKAVHSSLSCTTVEKSGSPSDINKTIGSYYSFMNAIASGFMGDVTMRYYFFQAMSQVTNQFDVAVTLNTESRSGSVTNSLTEYVSYKLNVRVTAPTVNSVSLTDTGIVF